MLTEEEKDKIRLEEVYRSTVKVSTTGKKSFLSKIDILKIIQTVAIASGIFISLSEYISNSANQRKEAARDYQKSFYQTQTNVYMEAVNATALLSTAGPDSKEYAAARQQFFELFWGRLSMYENKCVEARIVLFRKLLIKFEGKDYSPISYSNPCTNNTCDYDTISQVSLKFASLQLARECRYNTIKVWLTESERAQYNIDDSSACSTVH